MTARDLERSIAAAVEAFSTQAAVRDAQQQKVVASNNAFRLEVEALRKQLRTAKRKEKIVQLRIAACKERIQFYKSHMVRYRSELVAAR